jgi:MerR family transcriptional regulator, light-induced transcriptional regulator
MEVSYTIQMAAKISGVGVHTIRAWEKRYKAIVPKRDLTGHRVYSKEDIEKLILLSELCLLGYSISKIASMSISDLKVQLKELGKTEDSIKSLEMNLYETETEFVDYNQSLTIILLALKSYKLDIVAKEISKLKIVMNPRDFALKIILPIMSELGEAVMRGDYTISHEHALSSIVKFHIGHILYRSDDQENKDYITMVFCGVEQDYHEFGILIGALLAIHYRIKIYYLGPNLPYASAIDAMKFLEANYIVVGATTVVSSLGPNYLNNYVTKLAQQLDDKVKVIVGSSLPLEVPKDLQKKVIHLKDLESFDRYLSLLV